MHESLYSSVHCGHVICPLVVIRARMSDLPDLWGMIGALQQRELESYSL